MPLSTKSHTVSYVAFTTILEFQSLKSDQIDIKRLYVIGFIPACRDVEKSALWRVSKLEVTRNTYIQVEFPPATAAGHLTQQNEQLSNFDNWVHHQPLPCHMLVVHRIVQIWCTTSD